MEEFKKPLLPSAASPKIDKTSKDDDNFSIKEPPPEERGKEVAKPTIATSKTQPQTCPYIIPKWSNIPNDNVVYTFEVLKSGQIIDEVKNLQNKAFWTFGRLPENDVEMAHPTISRFHAILQYRPKSERKNDHDENQDDENNEMEHNKSDNERGPAEGWYIYDMDSTHGTFLNKQRIPPKVYIRIRVGHMLRLGASTRSYILQGPAEDAEPESELSITELKVKRQRDLEEAALEKKRLEEEAAARARNEGCGWGMGDDADEESDLTHNPYASTNNEELFLDDPKKTLRGYFEREGLQLEYKCDEMSAGSFVCRVELPLDNDNGRPIIAEVVHKGKKKDCVVQCALEACRILDRHGVLRQANQEPLRRKHKQNNSDSEDDEFWDRTGDVARKKQRKANVSTSLSLTYDDLLKQESDLNDELQQIESNIVAYQERQKQLKTQKDIEEGGDDLDSYMENLKAKEAPMDKTEIKKIRLEQLRLKTEIQRTQRLIKIAKPVELPFAKIPLNADKIGQQNDKKETKQRQLPMIGKRNQFSKFKVVKPSTTAAMTESKPKIDLASDEEELEEDGVEQEQTKVGEETIKIRVQDVFDKLSKEDESCEIPKQQESVNIKKDPMSPEKFHKSSTSQISKNKQQEISDADGSICQTVQSEDAKHLEDTEISSGRGGNKSAEVDLPVDNGKKRRHRYRQRGKRQEIDVEDEEEHHSSEKYAKWVPPENQTGDGFTELNNKFGY